ncbi:MAG: 2-keto-4-methylthiobutyrate aminotransferase [Chloroflexi bacterium]|nr:2-keto-4-methylthiobutyrate aminotransferase [Chloroflexota bacterium]
MDAISEKPVCYVNGQLVPEGTGAVSALDRGLLLGDGLFETMRVLGGGILQWQRHWERLHSGAQTIRLALPWTADELHQAVGQTLHANNLCEATVRLTVTRGFSPAARGLLPPADAPPTLLIRATPFAPYPDHLYRDGMRVIISRKVRRNEQSPLSRVKSLNYLDNILARQEAAEKSADEALMLNTRDSMACATAANVFCAHAGRLRTPPVADGALPGTIRALVREDLAPSLGRVVDETQLDESALLNSDEVFLTNALMGIMPVCAIDGRPLSTGAPGPVTRGLRAAYERWFVQQKTKKEGR